jgi:hypothetical protein
MENNRRTRFGVLCYEGRTRMGPMTCPEMARELGFRLAEVNEFERGEKQPPLVYVQAVIGLLALDKFEVFDALKIQYGSGQYAVSHQSKYGA